MAAAWWRQTESKVGQVAGFRHREGDFHGAPLFRAALFLGGIERRFERNVIVETLFLRVVNATRDSKGHNEERNFYHILCEISNRRVPSRKTFETQRKGGSGGNLVIWQMKRNTFGLDEWPIVTDFNSPVSSFSSAFQRPCLLSFS